MTTTLLGFLSITVGLTAGSWAGGEERVLTHLTGRVTDDIGRPIRGATVWSRDEYGLMPPDLAPDEGMRFGCTLSDASGHYRMDLEAEVGEPIEAISLSAQARGFVRKDLTFRSDKPVTKAGESRSLDLRLERGEVLAGTVRVPLRLRDRLNGQSPDRHPFFIRIRRPGFSQVHRTQPGGGFEIWVPEGRYTLLASSDLMVTQATLENVASGTRNLKLGKAEDSIGHGVLARAFDALWDDMGRNYSYFELKGIDWKALRSKYRPRAVESATLPAFVDVLGEMLGELNDGHVWFVEPEGAIVAYRRRPFRTNINVGATDASLEQTTRIGNGFALVGLLMNDRFGVVRITRQSRADESAVDQVVTFIHDHADAPGFLIDLRTADGGSEPLAQRIAREFAGQATVYAKSKYRDGPLPTDFGPVHDRVLEASATPFTKPVVCLLGPGCVSSGEGFAKMMKSLPHVTTLGLPTRGSSGNPRPFRLPGLPVTIMYSRWVDMLPDGTPIEGRGVAPEILVDLPESAYKDADPTWQRAIEVLREKARAARKPSTSSGICGGEE